MFFQFSLIFFTGKLSVIKSKYTVKVCLDESMSRKGKKGGERSCKVLFGFKKLSRCEKIVD